MTSNFYQGKSIVVLGGAGFVGQHLCRALEARGANVFVIDDFSRQGGITIDAEFNKNNKSYLNIKIPKILQIQLAEICPFAVFNLAAAVAGVEYNQKHHNQMFLDNVQLQTIPVMVCERLGVPHFLQVSSACVYGADANAPAIEGKLGGEPVAANAGYSWAKRMGERAIRWSKLKHAVIVRPSNIYGPGDWYDERAHVIPKLIQGYAEGTAKLFGGGKAIREFLYVEDAAEGMLHALEFGAHKEAYNLGGDDIALSMADLHFHIRDLMKVVYEAPNVAAEFDQGDNARFSDNLKMHRLGWKPQVRMYEGLKKTIEAYFER
jgi:nucleoside-diphosphate-sugar epimerase